jgi:hypothetical protein
MALRGVVPDGSPSATRALLIGAGAGAAATVASGMMVSSTRGHQKDAYRTSSWFWAWMHRKTRSFRTYRCENRWLKIWVT